MHKGQVTTEMDSVFGSHQGDPLGGHYFALGISDFATHLKGTHPAVCISWAVDDLTGTGTQEELAEVAELIETEGAEYIQERSQGSDLQSTQSTQSDRWRPSNSLTRHVGYNRGFRANLLGAPEETMGMIQGCQRNE